MSEMICGYKVHPAASLFPLIEGEEFDELCDSILKNGMRVPVLVDGDVLIDGRNRLRAVEALRAKGEKVKFDIVHWLNHGMNVSEWIWDVNAMRRHMSEDALVCASAEIWKLIQAENQGRKKATQFKKGQSGNPDGKKQAESKSSPPARRDAKAKDARSTAGQVAARAKVSLHKAKQAVKLDKAVEAGIVSPEVKQEVIAGKRKLSDAAKAIPAKAKKKAKTSSVDTSGPRELKSPKSAGYALQTLRALKRYLESLSLDQERVNEELSRIKEYRHWEVLGFANEKELFASHGIDAEKLKQSSRSSEARTLSEHVEQLADMIAPYRCSLKQLTAEQWKDADAAARRRLFSELDQLRGIIQFSWGRQRKADVEE
jgi:hypothetical protein